METQEEIWKDIVGYTGYYQVSSFGRIKSLTRVIINSYNKRLIKKEKILKTFISKHGYECVDLRVNNVKSKCVVHRLVATAFMPNIENKYCVNHINSNRLDNNVNNLEWCTQSENIKHGIKFGFFCVGGDRKQASISNKQAAEIKNCYLSGEKNQTKLAQKYGVSRQTVGNIIKGKTYKNATL